MEFSQGKTLSFTLREEQGELKSDEPTIYHGYTSADSDINATCVFETHGHWDGPTGKAATLFVIRFDLASHARRKFLTFQPLIEFKQLFPKKSFFKRTTSIFGSIFGSTPTKAKSLPRVADITFEPGARGNMIVREIHGETEQEYTYQASLGVTAPPPAPVNASVSAGKRENKKLPENYRYEISAGLRNQRHTVYWNATQAEELGDGIDKVQVAFVVFRDNDEDFAFDLNLNASADLIFNVIDSLLPWRAKGEVIIRPSQSNNSECPAGVDRDQLHKLKDNNNEGLVKLTHIHISEKWVDPKQVTAPPAATT